MASRVEGREESLNAYIAKTIGCGVLKNCARVMAFTVERPGRFFLFSKNS